MKIKFAVIAPVYLVEEHSKHLTRKYTRKELFMEKLKEMALRDEFGDLLEEGEPTRGVKIILYKNLWGIDSDSGIRIKSIKL
ncbi:hypothetical protein J6590_024728 [Homalodisca vitripennis]|nr:hypothetical protein J6590_024728 [Homalodisca vitripennis]